MFKPSIVCASIFAVSVSASAATQEYPDYLPIGGASPSSAPSTSASTPVEIVLTYTSGMEAEYGLGLRDHFNDEIAWLNDALVRAGRTGGARLVGLRLIDYPDDYATDFRECQDEDHNYNPITGIGFCENLVIYGAIYDLQDAAVDGTGSMG